MWTHLERQAGGLVKGMGEKQIEVDKRILRTQVSCAAVEPAFKLVTISSA
jgi:GTP-binding protein HflX